MLPTSKLKTTITIGLAAITSAALLTGCSSNETTAPEATPQASTTAPSSEATTSSTPAETTSATSTYAAPEDKQTGPLLKEGELVRDPENPEWGTGSVMSDQEETDRGRRVNVWFQRVPIEEFVIGPVVENHRTDRMCLEAKLADEDVEWLTHRIAPISEDFGRPTDVACSPRGEDMSEEEVRAYLDEAHQQLIADGYLQMSQQVFAHELERVG